MLAVLCRNGDCGYRSRLPRSFPPLPYHRNEAQRFAVIKPPIRSGGSHDRTQLRGQFVVKRTEDVAPGDRLPKPLAINRGTHLEIVEGRQGGKARTAEQIGDSEAFEECTIADSKRRELRVAYGDFSRERCEKFGEVRRLLGPPRE